MESQKKKKWYLLTRLYATDFFKETENEVIAAFLFPFSDVQGRGPYPDTDEDFKRKCFNIKNDRHGIHNNYSSQGFGNTPFYTPHVRFRYFYQRLGLLEAYIKKNSESKEDSFINMESVALKNNLIDILSSAPLFFGRNEIPEDVKKILLRDLDENGNQYVMAELLYYIVSRPHALPDVEKQAWDDLYINFRSDVPLHPNVPMHLRKDFDISEEEMAQKLEYTKELQLMFFHGSSFLDANQIIGYHNNFFEVLSKRLESEKPINVEIIINEEGCDADREAIHYKIKPYHCYERKEKLAPNSLSGIKQLMEKKCSKGSGVHGKTTKLFLPYSLTIFRFEDSSRDYIKADIYSPFVANEKRPCFYAFQSVNPDIFEHFLDVFREVWNAEEISEPITV